MRCQQDRGHIFPESMIINNYLSECGSQLKARASSMGADVAEEGTCAW